MLDAKELNGEGRERKVSRWFYAGLYCLMKKGKQIPDTLEEIPWVMYNMIFFYFSLEG